MKGREELESGMWQSEESKNKKAEELRKSPSTPVFLHVWKNLDLADTFECISFGTSLVDSVTEFGRGIDELEVDLFEVTTRLGNSHALT